MDVAIVLFTALPFIVIAGIRMARRRRHAAHRNVQSGTFALVLLVIVLFEIDIRLSGGTEAFLRHTSVNAGLVRGILLFHVLVAVATALSWGLVIARSWRRFQTTLPGAFTRWHTRAGRVTFWGICAISSTGCLLYVLLFVL